MSTFPAVVSPIEPSRVDALPVAPPPNVEEAECPADDDDDDARWDALPCTD